MTRSQTRSNASPNRFVPTAIELQWPYTCTRSSWPMDRFGTNVFRAHRIRLLGDRLRMDVDRIVVSGFEILIIRMNFKLDILNIFSPFP